MSMLSKMVIVGLAASAVALGSCAGGGRADTEPRIPDYTTEPIGVNSGDLDVERSMRRYTNASHSSYAHPNVSYDGQHLAYVATTVGPEPQVFVQRKDRHAARQITFGPGRALHPAISYGSDEIAFSSNKDGRFQIWIAPLDRPGPWEAVSGQDTDAFHPSWSPCGKRLVYSMRENDNAPWKLVVHHRLSGQQDILGRGSQPSWSPDGSQIAFQRTGRNAPGYTSLWTIRPNGDHETMVYQSDTHGAMNPSWAGSEWILFATVNKSRASFRRENGEIFNADDIWMVRKDGAQPRMVTSHRLADWDPTFDHATGEIVFISNRDGVQNIFGMKANITVPDQPANRFLSAGGR
jgi:Tol biopolymer transport system component